MVQCSSRTGNNLWIFLLDFGWSILLYDGGIPPRLSHVTTLTFTMHTIHIYTTKLFTNSTLPFVTVITVLLKHQLSVTLLSQTTEEHLATFVGLSIVPVNLVLSQSGDRLVLSKTLSQVLRPTVQIHYYVFLNSQAK